ncbi:hypothetical protein B0H14DRAFT_3894290 [Mycena olivaceomarginata]|nr:hypothetical protein B0H14DRAFT_3894290 [Mycena olivaceomarginata]
MPSKGKKHQAHRKSSTFKLHSIPALIRIARRLAGGRGHSTDWYKCGPRYDCLLFDTADGRLACARLRSLVRCQLPSGRIVDVAMVQLVQKSSWGPQTHWDGCLVFDECREIDFLLVEHIMRGTLLAPVRPAPSGRSHSHYLVDVIDGDILELNQGSIEPCERPGQHLYLPNSRPIQPCRPAGTSQRPVLAYQRPMPPQGPIEEK